jgi:hypothetical protein
MMKRVSVLLLTTTLLLAAGCSLNISLDDLFGNGTTTVQLVNTGDFDIDVVLYIGEDEDAAESILTTFGDRIELTIPANQIASFSRDSEDIRAIVIDNAEINIIGGIGPEEDTRVYRERDDFSEGDTLVFTFSYEALPIDLDITFDRN